MLATLLLAMVVLLIAYLVHKQKLRKGEEGLPLLGPFFDAIAPSDPSIVPCTPPSSPICRDLSTTTIVEPTKSLSTASESLASTQVDFFTSPSFVDEQPTESAADIAPPAVLETNTAIQPVDLPVDRIQAEQSDIGGHPSTAPEPDPQPTADLIHSEDAAEQAEPISDFKIKNGNQEEQASDPPESAPAGQDQKESSLHRHHHRRSTHGYGSSSGHRHRHWHSEDAECVSTESNEVAKQPNIVAEKSPRPVEPISDFKIKIDDTQPQIEATPTPDTTDNKMEDKDASEEIVKGSTAETAGTTNEKQPDRHRGSKQSSHRRHRHKSMDSTKPPREGAVPSSGEGQTTASTSASPAEKRRHRHRSRSASDRRRSHRSSSLRRSQATGQGGAVVKDLPESPRDGASAAQEAANQDTNEAAGSSDKQPKRHHHRRSASARHRTHRSSSSRRRLSKSMDAADDAEVIKDSTSPQVDLPQQQDVQQ